MEPERWNEEREQLELLLDKNPFADGASYDQVRLIDCCTDALWDRLMEPASVDWI